MTNPTYLFLSAHVQPARMSAETTFTAV